MSNYRYELLNDKEFEQISRDLLQNELHVKLQSFKSGKDKGIDARYSGSKDNLIIMQAKHYSNFSNLKKEFKNETIKIKKLSPLPDKYFLFTSLDLSLRDLDEIFDIGKSLLKKKDNIFYKTKIDNLISAKKNKYIEEKYYKLWINSTNILKRILRNGEIGSSEFHENKIRQLSSLYVTTKHFHLALKKLKNKKCLIISGEPGVGKTTLANNLIYNFLAKDFKLIYIDTFVAEAESLLSKDPRERQIIFFDDFLGTYIDLLNSPKNSDSKILNFFERIISSKNKYLILTSRTIFLNSIKYNSEKIKNSQIELSDYELKIEEYNIYEKALILYNHLYYYDKSRMYLNFIRDKNFYNEIIYHTNYNPRIIEFITKQSTFKEYCTKEKYVDYILKCLAEPNLIWEHSYKSEIDYESKALIDAIFTLGKQAGNEELVKKCFFQRLKYYQSTKNVSSSFDSYNKSIKTLQNSFILTKKYIGKPSIKFELINPSLGDYLIHFYNGSAEEKTGLIESSISMHQIENVFHPNKKGFINLTKTESKYYKNFIVSKYRELASNSSNSYSSSEAYIIHILIDRFDFLDIKKEIYQLLKEMKIQEISSLHLFYLLSFLSRKQDLGILKYIRKNILSLTSAFLENISDSYDISLIKEIFSNNKIDFHEFIEQNNLTETYNSKVNECIEYTIKTSLDDLDFLENDDLFNKNGDFSHDHAKFNFEKKLNKEIRKFSHEINEEINYNWSHFISESDIVSSINAIVDSWETSEEKIKFVESPKIKSEKSLKEKIENLFN